MNSLPWIGKILGCLGADAVIERMGYKKTIYIVCAIQFVGVTRKSHRAKPCYLRFSNRLSSGNGGHRWIQFTIGRVVVAYIAVGLVENAVPAYNAESSPAAARGLMAGSLMTVTALGNIWGAGMSRA
jgi:MFS transporter, SP family, sugar:H+ symporter